MLAINSNDPLLNSYNVPKVKELTTFNSRNLILVIRLGGGRCQAVGWHLHGLSVADPGQTQAAWFQSLGTSHCTVLLSAF